MPVVPYRTVIQQHRSAIHAALTQGYQQAICTNRPHVVSLSLPIPSIDPLRLLHQSSPYERHLYLENTSQHQATVALGSLIEASAIGPSRFDRVHNFIETWCHQISCYDELAEYSPGIQFFCSFAFFDTPTHSDSPFPAASVFLPRWQITQCRQTSTLIANLLLTPLSDLEALLPDILQQLRRIESLAESPLSAYPPAPSLIQPALATQVFTQAVHRALQRICHNRLRKIVLAHALDVLASQPFNRAQLLERLRQQHPDCYVFSVGNGHGVSFIGASPERLLSIRQRRLITDALAGSSPRGDTAETDALLARQLLTSVKEQDEHQFVVDFLVRRLTELGLRPSYRTRPGLLQLSNIQHLHTPIRATVPLHTHPLHLVKALHPTPAVAGVPTDQACQQIRRFEQFDRALYAAPIGWIDHQGNSEFIVGIRSALIQANRARLYAGAGIVAGSDPERELDEIRLKLRALMEALV
ncbi:Salicylate biosynthesis isochorismate synthase [Halomicronema hongdechloris C2206]|uniref:isochorismate synthase n=1 Tax=Halomicronema hongdechloris C2206 TaxID=1641165 RepID=A0A1Z3HP69_9CYAN|nr:isochorismate synthase [Halomicronema hongdechloris]ASC72114.1 Salicylate biosynthesis isochorismate synthase [Halomicronema hongdechloris C2206]